MSRALALVLLAAALPARAQSVAAGDPQAPARVSLGAVRAQTEALRDAVASPATSEVALRGEAAALFEALQRETPVVRPTPRRMDREEIDGRLGTIDGMIAEAQRRSDHYRLATGTPPPALTDSIIGAKALRAQGRADFDAAGRMPDNQMGVFRYDSTKLEGGIVEVNRWMALIAARLGEAFAYATLVHEATHALAREQGRLSPERVVDGEVEAFRVQYLWLTVMDPLGERAIVLDSVLKLRLRAHPEDEVSRLALAYVDHLIEVRDTGGEDEALRKLVEKLGYEENAPGERRGATGA